jgi:hypothetical protein
VDQTTADRGAWSVRFGSGELTGALGDSVTVLPLVVAVCALTPASLPHVLLAFAAAQVVWGVAYGLPISVEPMKALAGLAVAGTVSYAELAAAGLLAGVVLLAAGRARLLSRLADAVGTTAVRGVQLAVALVLARAGLELGVDAPFLALAGVGLVALVALVGRPRAAALVVLAAGVALAAARTGVPTPALPRAAPFPVGTPTLTADAVEATAAQLAMTVGNAAVATAALCADLFDRDVSPDALAGSMGATCLLAVPAGGLPMCHGSGGLAGKHAFGARTGGANLALGGLYAAGALVAGVVAAVPTALLGVLLCLVAASLARTALTGVDSRRARTLVLVVGLVGLAWNVGAAFLLGALADATLRRAA